MGSLLLEYFFATVKHVDRERAMRATIREKEWATYAYTRGDWQLLFLETFLNF